MQVELLHGPGFPLRILNIAAKQCYSEGSACDKNFGDDSVEDMKKRIVKIIRSGHHSILEHVSWTFGIKGISRACLAQLTRHRVGCSYSVQSQRYVDFKDILEKDDFIIPGGFDEKTAEDYKSTVENILEMYKGFASRHPDMKPEDVRYLLPNAAPVNLIMTMNARAFMNFFHERLCRQAQTEIRKLAELIRCKLILEFFIFEMKEFGPKCEWLKRCPQDISCARK
jgi:thymidylate synthase (FAD)